LKEAIECKELQCDIKDLILTRLQNSAKVMLVRIWLRCSYSFLKCQIVAWH